MNTLPSLGIDPGSRNGAAVLLSPDGHTVLWWGCYATVSAGHRIKDASCAPPVTWQSFEHAVVNLSRLCWMGATAKREESYTLTVEGLFNARGSTREAQGKRLQLLKLAESAGVLIGAFSPWSAGSVYRPKAADGRNGWRYRQLGLQAKTDATKAEAYAVEMAPHRFTWTPEFPAHLTKVELGAVCEAAFIAADGLTHHNSPAPKGTQDARRR